MYELKISIKNLNSDTEKEFNRAAHSLVEQLQETDKLTIELGEEKVENTRGAIALLSSIVVKAVELGIFAGIWTLLKDFRDRYHNAEVELLFKDGSKMTVNNLTYEQAKEIMEKHGKSST